MEISRAKELVKEKLPDKRYQHSLRVADTAVKLAEIYDGDIKKKCRRFKKNFEKVQIFEHFLNQVRFFFLG